MLCEPLEMRKFLSGRSEHRITHHESIETPWASIPTLSGLTRSMDRVDPGHELNVKRTMREDDLGSASWVASNFVSILTTCTLKKSRAFCSASLIADGVPHCKFRECKPKFRKKYVAMIALYVACILEQSSTISYGETTYAGR